MHAYHEQLPGFDAEQILHDGCDECEQRGFSVSTAIGALDPGNFVRAWERAAQWNQHGLSNVSAAEAPLLNALWAIQCQLENRSIRIGDCPGVEPLKNWLSGRRLGAL